MTTSSEGPTALERGRVGGRVQSIIKSRIDPNRPNDLPSALPAVSLWLSSGAALEAEDAEGMTALHYAATSDYNMPIIALLAAYGAKITGREDPICGVKALS